VCLLYLANADVESENPSFGVAIFSGKKSLWMKGCQDLETTATQNSSEESGLKIHRKLFLSALKIVQTHFILRDINLGALLLL